MTKRKFKTGDRVLIKDNSKIEGGMYAGAKGVIVGDDEGLTYPYNVKFESSELGDCPFRGTELAEEAK